MFVGCQQSQEKSAANFAFLSATIIIAQQIAGKATRDSLFLTYFEVTDLPKVVIVAGLISILAVITMSRLLSRFGPAALMPAIFGVSASLHIGEWFIFTNSPEAATILLYFHVGVFSAILISGFWSVVNERFDPHTAKSTISQVTVAATLGGVLGAFVAERVSYLVDLQAMLLVLAGMHGVCSFSVSRVGRYHSHHQPTEESIHSGFQVLFKAPYLRQMVALMVLIAVVSALLDYALKAEAANRFESGDSLVTFFVIFYATTGVSSFFVQILLGRKALSQLGLGGTIAVLPGTIVIGGMIGTILTNVWLVVFLRGIQSTLAHSLFRSGFELLYTPLSLDKKRPTKTMIDVGSDRIGDIISGGLILILVSLLTEVPTALIVGFAVIASALTLVLVYLLHHGYVKQLAERLRSQRELCSGDIANKTVSNPAWHQLQDIAEYKHAASNSTDKDMKTLGVGSVSSLVKVVPTNVETTCDPLYETIHVLRSGNILQIKKALQVTEFAPPLVPHLVPLLAYAELEHGVTRVLARMGPDIVDQLIDAMLNMNNPLAVRSRLPRILEKVISQQAVNGLLSGLFSHPFEIRYEIGQALGRMKAENSNLYIDRKVIFESVRMELQVDKGVRGGQGEIIDNAHSQVSGLTANGAQGLPNNAALHHVLLLLGLVIDREVLQLCRFAFISNDTYLRGTALEYLENVLPESIRKGLKHHIQIHQSAEQSEYYPRENVNELSQSAKVLMGDRGQLNSYPEYTHGDYIIILLTGKLALEASLCASRQILQHLDKQHNVLVDLSAVESIDRFVIASLVEGMQRAKQNTLKFGLLRVQETAMQVLQATHLDEAFPIYDSLESLK